MGNLGQTAAVLKISETCLPLQARTILTAAEFENQTTVLRLLESIISPKTCVGIKIGNHEINCKNCDKPTKYLFPNKIQRKISFLKIRTKR